MGETLWVRPYGGVALGETFRGHMYGCGPIGAACALNLP